MATAPLATVSSAAREVRKVSFTGGISAARRIQTSASVAPKPVALELGGKSANIIFGDADVERATTMAAIGALYMSGQGWALPTPPARALVDP
jgi:aldehyde dehydrogenase (NAD+)